MKKWILDFLICNGLGIYFGMKTCELFSMLPYNWRGLWHIPTFKGKLSDAFQKINWEEFSWKPSISLKNFLYFFSIISLSLLGELNTFYLKYILWIPPSNFLCLGRLIFLLLVGTESINQAIEYFENP